MLNKSADCFLSWLLPRLKRLSTLAVRVGLFFLLINFSIFSEEPTLRLFRSVLTRSVPIRSSAVAAEITDERKSPAKSDSHALTMSWLRVFRRAEASRMRPGVGQHLHTSAVRSEQCVRLRGSAWARMRVIAVFFCPRAPDLLTWRMSVLSHDFKRVERFPKLATSSVLIV